MPAIREHRKLVLLVGDLTDQIFMLNCMTKCKPDEIYNLAAQTQVHHSFECPAHTFEVNVNGLINICQGLVTLGMQENVRVFHASTSEMFGDFVTGANETIVSEGFPFNPMSPYAASKISAYYLV